MAGAHRGIAERGSVWILGTRGATPSSLLNVSALRISPRCQQKESPPVTIDLCARTPSAQALRFDVIKNPLRAWSLRPAPPLGVWLYARTVGHLPCVGVPPVGVVNVTPAET